MRRGSDRRPSGSPSGGEPPSPANGRAIPAPAAAEDIELARRLRLGDADALAALYDRYAPTVHGLTRSILRDDQLAEEATHDVFLGLWQHPHTYEAARGPFGGWLLRIARNRAIDLLRRRRERPFATATAVDGTATTGEIDVASWLVDPDPDPADQAVDRTVREEVRAALAQLAPDHRRLLELAYFGGLTQREIATLLDRPLGTVKTQIRTAMQRLAVLLAGVAASPTRAATPVDAAPRRRGGPDPAGALDPLPRPTEGASVASSQPRGPQ